MHYEKAPLRHLTPIVSKNNYNKLHTDLDFQDVYFINVSEKALIYWKK